MRAIANLGALTIGFFSSTLILPAMAQITSDGTTNTVVNAINNNFTIINGIEKSNNLFHSFSNFSVPTGGSASFDLVNTPNITTIFSRVTGGNISQIDGLIQTLNANHPVSLFLMNPAGIVFGQNASLNIGGSFVGTTANSIKFADGTEFRAVNSTEIPLLTMSVPVGLQMGSNAGAIAVQGTPANNFFFRMPTLSMAPNQTLALVGGQVDINSASISAPDNRVELWAIQNSTVNILTSGNWQLASSSSSPTWGTVTLRQSANINTSGVIGGAINIRGRGLTLQDGSHIESSTGANQQGQGINVQTTEFVDLLGVSHPENYFLPGLTTNVTGSAATAGNIQIDTQRLRLVTGAWISSLTSMDSNTGTPVINSNTGQIIVRATDVEVQGYNPTPNFLGSYFVSAIATLVTGGQNNNSGAITVDAERVRLLDGARFSTDVLGPIFPPFTPTFGNAGDISVTARESLEIRGTSPELFSSAIISSIQALAVGQAGNIQINAGQFSLANGGTISSAIAGNENAAFAGNGTAGNITIQATNVEVSDPVIDVSTQAPGGITVAIGQNATGRGGNINLTADNLRVFNGGQITSSTDGNGAAGNLNLQVKNINVEGISQTLSNGQILPSRITASSTTSFAAGSINIQSDTLSISNGGEINASTQIGQGGDIQLQISDTLKLNNQGQILANAQAAGQGGNINIAAGTTILGQDSTISTNAQGTAKGGALNLISDRLSLSGASNLSVITGGSGKAGDLFVQARDIEITGVAYAEVPGFGLIPNPSYIGAGAFPGSSGEGGSITIMGDRIRILDGGFISAGTSSGIGKAGDVTVIASELLEVRGIGDFPAPLFSYFTNHPSRISATSLSDAAAGSVKVQAPSIVVADGGVIEVNGAGAGGAGNLNLVGDRISLINGASLQAQVAGGDQGNITIGSNLLLLRNGSTITTNATGTASGGNIAINSPIIIGLENSDIIANAVAGNGGNIQITTQGLFGLQLRDQLTPESDITASSEFGVSGTVQINNFGVDPNSGLVELPANVTDSSQQIAAGCIDTSNSSFIATGRGGIPQNPNQQVMSARTWSDMRDISAYRNTEAVQVQSPDTFVQATSWRRNAQGKIELVADNSSRNGQLLLTCAAAPKS
jgi:filamentous hemagglutinin family protein